MIFELQVKLIVDDQEMEIIPNNQGPNDIEETDMNLENSSDSKSERKFFPIFNFANANLARKSKKKHSRKKLSLDDKVKIIQESKELGLGKNKKNFVAKITKNFDISKNAIYGIFKNQDDIMKKAAKQTTDFKSKPFKRAAKSALEIDLYNWYLQNQNTGIKIDDEMLKKKALDLESEIYNLENPQKSQNSRKFSFTNRWLHNFKKRYDISLDQDVLEVKVFEVKNQVPDNAGVLKDLQTGHTHEGHAHVGHTQTCQTQAGHAQANQDQAGHAQAGNAQEISSSATERRKSETQADLEESTDNLKGDNAELQVSKKESIAEVPPLHDFLKNSDRRNKMAAEFLFNSYRRNHMATEFFKSSVYSDQRKCLFLLQISVILHNVHNYV